MFELPEELTEHLRTIIGQEGIDFFRLCRKQTGCVNPFINIADGPVTGDAYDVNQVQGIAMQKIIKEYPPCEDWPDDLVKEMWSKIIDLAISQGIDDGALVYEKMKIVRQGFADYAEHQKLVAKWQRRQKSVLHHCIRKLMGINLYRRVFGTPIVE